MSNTASLMSNWRISAIVAVLLGWFSATTPPAAAQGSQGQNAVYNASNGIVGSSAFIDASMFPASGRDFCGVVNWILNPAHGILPAAGGVIDARGLPGNTGTSMTCSASPWAGITSPPSSTILLPAGTIVISTPWVLPSNTRLIGEGEDITAAGSTPGTTLQAQSGFTTGAAMISFGQSSPVCTAPCTGISVEYLNLDGTGQSINGIANAYAQDFSYVDHVGLYRILGTGLSVSGNASNSGPYSNITFDLGGDTGTPSTVCASINGSNGLSGTRGIHGLSCTSESNDAPAAVLLDASNNSIEDVRIVGFYDGIRGAGPPLRSL